MTCSAGASASATKATPRPRPRSSAGRTSAAADTLPAGLVGFRGRAVSGRHVMKFLSRPRFVLAIVLASAIGAAGAQEQPSPAEREPGKGVLRLLPADS